MNIPTSISYAPASKEDLSQISILNEQNLPHLSTAKIELFEYFLDNSSIIDIAKIDEQIVGFVIALFPNLDYNSLNYRWFDQRYENYCYIDRIAVHSDFNGLGIGSQLYDRVIKQISGRSSYLVCEVNTLPPNQNSMRFHERYGFVPVGTQQTEGGKKEVALLLKDLSTV